MHTMGWLGRFEDRPTTPKSSHPKNGSQRDNKTIKRYMYTVGTANRNIYNCGLTEKTTHTRRHTHTNTAGLLALAPPAGLSPSAGGAQNECPAAETALPACTKPPRPTAPLTARR